MSHSFHFSLIFCAAGLVALIFFTGCTSSMPAFSGIYVREEAPQNFLEFRSDGSVYSVLNYQFRQIGTWSRLDKDQIQVCYDDYCFEMGIGDNSLFYYNEGKQYTLFKVDERPVITTKPTIAPSDAIPTSTYSICRDLELVGNVFGFASASRAGNLEYILFMVGSIDEGKTIDLSKITISYSDKMTHWPALEYVPGTSVSEGSVTHSAKWGIREIRCPDRSDASSVLPGGCQASIIMGVPSTAVPDEAFEVTLAMPDGSEIHMKKTVVHQIEKINILY